MTRPCKDCRELLAAAQVEALGTEDQRELAGHLSKCAECRAYLEALRQDDHLLTGFARSMEERVGALEERVVQMLDARFEETGDRRGWRVAIPSGGWVKYAAAAAIIVAAALGIRAFSGPELVPVAWAEVLAQVEAAEDYICQTRAKAFFGEEPSDPTGFDADSAQFTGVRYKSHEHGTRDDQLFQGQVVASNYLLRTLEQINADRADSVYFVVRMSESEFSYNALQVDAQELVATFARYPYRELEPRVIDGSLAWGIELEDPEFLRGSYDHSTIRLWADEGSGWPVRLETILTSENGLTLATIMDEFEWNPALPADLFNLDFLDAYRLAFEVEAPIPDEEHALGALSVYAQLMAGNYPRTLTWGAALSGLIGAQQAGELPTGEQEREQISRLVFDIRHAVQFLVLMGEEGRDVVYNGGTVSAEALDRVLLRWRLDDGNYRVVYGDLRGDTVSAERLAELESGR